MQHHINYIRLLTEVSTYSPLLPLLCGIKKWSSLVWLYILTSLIFNILVANIFTSDRLSANIYLLVEFAFIWLYFKRKLYKQYKWALYSSLILCTIAIASFWGKDIHAFNWYCATTLSICYLGFCVIALYIIMQDADVVNIFSSSFFLVTLALLIYFSSMFMLFAAGSYFERHEQLWGFQKHALMGGLWMLNSAANIIQSLILTRALLVTKKDN